MASQQVTVRRPRLPLASLTPRAAPPSNQVLLQQPRPSFNIRPSFDQNFRLPIAQPPRPTPPPPAAVKTTPPIAAPRDAAQHPKPQPSTPANSTLPNSKVTPKLISPTPTLTPTPTPTPTPPPSPFQAPLALSTTAPTIITAPAPAPAPAPPTTPTVPLSKSQPNTFSQSPKTTPISHPPSSPREIKKVSDSKGLGVKKIITLAGDKNGAIMELSPYRKKGNSNELEGDSEYPVVAHVNSTVHGVNNSIVFNSCLSHHSPGVHLISHVYTKPNSGTNK